MRTIHGVLATLGAGAASLGLAASASAAPALVLDRACVNQRQPFNVGGTGFAPGQRVNVRPFAGRDVTFTADPAGNFAGAVIAPLASSGGGPVAIIAEDAANTRVDLATASIMNIRPRLLVLPTLVNAERPFRLSVRGLTPGQPVFAHVRLYGKWVRTRQIGVATAPCGVLSAKRPVLRGLLRKRRYAGATTLTIQVDQAQAPSLTQRPAGIATLIFRAPVRSAGLWRHRLQLLRKDFRDALPAPGTIP